MKPFQKPFFHFEEGIFFSVQFSSFIAFTLDECENQPCSSVVVGTVTLVLEKLRRYAPFHLNLRLPSTPPQLQNTGWVEDQLAARELLRFQDLFDKKVSVNFLNFWYYEFSKQCNGMVEKLTGPPCI